MNGFEKVCNLKDLIENAGLNFFVNDEEIAIFLVNGEVFAMNNVCPHQHAAILCDGFIEEGFVVCPAHGWQFRLRDGKRRGDRKGVESYPVRIIEGKVYVKVAKKEFVW